jgi:pimeloyl-ACP methyl ester carboxylesterase
VLLTFAHRDRRSAGASFRRSIVLNRRRLVAFVAGLAFVAAAGGAFQAIATARDVARFPMPGQRVDIGGRSLHLFCSGEGHTTVLLENGLGGVYPAWRPVQRGLAQFARACSYDRAGLGYSDGVDREARADFVAADLALLIDAAQLSPPFVLVGWSAGGLYMRRFYRDHPDGVVGMVLVDSGHEQQRARLGDHDENRQRAIAELNVCRGLSWAGLVRMANVMDEMAAPLHFSADIRPEFVAMENRTGYCAADLKEFVGFEADTAEHDPPHSLGDLPLVVIARGRTVTANDFDHSMDAARLAAFDRDWNALQRELAALSTRSSFRVAASGHAIPLEAPETIVEAVRDIIAGRVGS